MDIKLYNFRSQTQFCKYSHTKTDVTYIIDQQYKLDCGH